MHPLIDFFIKSAIVKHQYKSVASPRVPHKNTIQVYSDWKRSRRVAAQRAEILKAIESGAFSADDFPYIWPENRTYFGL